VSHAPSELNKWTTWTLVDGVDEYLAMQLGQSLH
jgi:hypothetical protein